MKRTEKVVNLETLQYEKRAKDFVFKAIVHFKTHIDQQKYFIVSEATDSFLAKVNEIFNDYKLGLKAERCSICKKIVRVYVDDPFLFKY